MRVDELRDELNEIAARVPRPATDARAAVLDRGRRLVRRRRIAQASTALVAVAGIAGGVALWQSDRGPSRPRVVTNQPASAPTTVTPRTAPPTSVPATTVAPVSPLTSAAATSTTVKASTRTLVPPDVGFAYASTPVVTGDSVFVIEANQRGATNVDARVVRIDRTARAIVASSDQPGAAAVVVAGGRVWVGLATGTNRPFGAPTIQRVAGLDVQTLAPLSTVTLPAPGTEDLVTTSSSVWALSGSDAIRIDTATGHVAATVALSLPASNPYRTLAVSDDGAHLYVGWATPNQVEGVTEYDATSGAKLHENADVGGGPANIGPALDFAGTRLWATFATGSLGSAVALDAGDLTTTGDTVGGPNSLTIAPVGNVVWVSRDATLDCVDLHDTTIASHTLAGGVFSGAAPTSDAVYVSTGDGLAIVAPDQGCAG